MFNPILALSLIFATAALSPVAARFMGKHVGWVLAIPPFAVFAWVLSGVPYFDDRAIHQSYSWLPQVGINFSFFVDGLGALFALLITFIGAMIAIYASGYFGAKEKLIRFYPTFFTFMGAMLGLVIADDLITLFLFWELTSITSFLLIGFYHERPSARRAAQQALLITFVGGLFILAGILLIQHQAGTLSLSELLSKQQDFGYLYPAIFVCIVIGSFAKSAQFPLHFWLPNAMEGPTPVSAYLHSATMVKAGVFLLARMHPILGDTAAWIYTLGIFGGITAIWGGILALQQSDAKRVLAYTTVSALGLCIAMIGIGTEEALIGFSVFVVGHALYKGALFMVVGTVDHQTGTRDVFQLGKLARKMPITAVGALFGMAGMMGLPFVFGFTGKDYALEGLFTAPTMKEWFFVVGGVFALTGVLAALICVFQPFFGRTGPEFATDEVQEGSPSLWIGPIALGAASLISFIFLFSFVREVIAPSVLATVGESVPVKVDYFHGLTPALIGSFTAILLGCLLLVPWAKAFKYTEPVTKYLVTSLDAAYDWCIFNLVTASSKISGVVQHGYLRHYFAMFFTVFIVAVGYPLIFMGAAGVPRQVDWMFPHEAALVFVLVISYVTALFSKSRLAAVAILGVAGFALAVIYMVFGAPDLSMTQLLVEALTVILFVLVFYHLPRFSKFSTPFARIRDALLALSFGAVMTLAVLTIMNSPQLPGVYDFYLENALPKAYGTNVVNVILVDFRGLDTFGEVIVIALAGIGVYSLLKLKPQDANKPAEILEEPE